MQLYVETLKARATLILASVAKTHIAYMAEHSEDLSSIEPIFAEPEKGRHPRIRQTAVTTPGTQC